MKYCPSCANHKLLHYPDVYLNNDGFVCAKCVYCGLQANPANTLQEAISNWNNQKFYNFYTLPVYEGIEESKKPIPNFRDRYSERLLYKLPEY